MIPAGSLRHKISIENQADGNDATTGERTTVWTLIDNRRAKIKPLRGAELSPASGELLEVTAKIFIRYDSSLSAISSRTRITDLNNGDVYDVESVINIDEENRIIELMAAKRSR